MEGGKGAAELARTAVELIETQPSSPVRFTYDDDDTPQEKITKVARNIYGAGTVTFSDKALKELAQLQKWGLGQLPVCIAKTQYSFSADPKRYGSETGFEFHIKDIELNAGGGFIVALAGEIMRMPGLGKVPQAMFIHIADDGNIEGIC